MEPRHLIREGSKENGKMALDTVGITFCRREEERNGVIAGGEEMGSDSFCCLVCSKLEYISVCL